MIRFLIYRPVSVIVLVVGLLILSIFTILRLNVSLLPDSGIPRLTVIVEAPGYTPTDMEQKVLAPMRRYLSVINNIENIQSIANSGSGELQLDFSYGSNLNKTFIETNEMIDLSMDDLSKEIDRPRVIRTRAEDLPVYYLSLKYKKEFDNGSFLQLSEYAKQVFRRRLEQLPEIALVDVHGLKNMQIVIHPNDDHLATLGIDQITLQNALIANQITLTSITIKEREYQYLVRIGKSLINVNDINNTSVRIGDRMLKIGDLANVKIEEQTSSGQYYHNGDPAISLAIIKSPKASLNILEKSLNNIIEQIESERPDLELIISRDQTKLLRATLFNLQTSLVLACILAIGIVFFFYTEWRIPIIIGIIIPVSLLISLFLFYWVDLSLNMISISGTLLGLGLMIDNGIIVLDNISQERNTQPSIDLACIIGTNQMIRPLLTSMLTTCSIFFPMVMISGIAGTLFWDQVIAVSICLMVSYVVSIILLPTLYFAILKPKKDSNIERTNIFTRTLKKAYQYGFIYTFKYSYIILFLLGLFILSAYLLLNTLPLERFPVLPEEAFEVNIDWNAPIQPEISANRIKDIFNNIKVPWQAHLGVSQYFLNGLYKGDLNSASIYVKIPENVSVNVLKSKILKSGKRLYPRSSINFSAEKTPFDLLFPVLNNTITAQCFISEQDESNQIKTFKEIYNSIENMSNIRSLSQPDYDKTYLVQPNRENMILYDVETDLLVAELKKRINGLQILELTSFQQTVPLVIKGNSQGIEALSHLGKVKNRNGVLIPMHQLISIKSERSLRKIQASKAGRHWPIFIDTDQPEFVAQQIEAFDKSMQSVKIELVGAYKENKKLILELVNALLIAVIILYFLLTAQFESFLQPLIILLEIPISLSGSIIFLYLFGDSINIMSLTGMIVTTGIIINDSIIKIDTINRLRKGGCMLKESIHKAGIKRLNPIVMTSLTTILAVLPFLWGTDIGSMLQRPLALSLIGGMIVGTVVSLYIIPLFYFLIYKNELE